MERQNEREQMASLLDRLPVGVVELNPQLRVVRVNRALARLAGVQADSVVGRTLGELLPDIASSLGPTLSVVLETGVPFDGIEIAVGKQRFVLSAFPVPPGLGLTISLKPPELPTWSPLLDRDAVFRAIFDRAAVGMIILDWRGGGARFNAAICQMLGYTEEELARVGIQAITHPDDWAADLALFERLMAKELDHYQLEKRYIRKDKSVFWGRLLVSAARDESSELSFLVSMLEDVTERHNAEENRERVIGALEEAVKARETFLSVASHELKTPLTPLRVSLERLQTASGENDQAQGLTMAIRQVDRLTALVEKLLDVSHIATGRLALACVPFDLTEEAREIVERFRGDAESAGSRLTLVAPGPVHTVADRARVEQILSNLIANALKFGEGQPVEIEVSSSGETACLRVRDYGLGIAPENQERIFGRFEKVDTGVRTSGLGLGLYIAHQIAEAHGGNIRVESPGPGSGSTFVVELPRA